MKIILRRWKQTWSVDITNHVQGVYINTGNKQIIAHIKQNKRDALMYDIYPQGINLTFIKNITMQNSKSWEKYVQ